MQRILFVLLAFCIASQGHAVVRLKDIASLRGAHDSQLVGYGLVVGLQGTGDTLRNTPFTEQSIQAMLGQMGINVNGTALRNRNVAAVLVTADMPPDMTVGARMDVTVSALGDAPSLQGGTLLMTQLPGADGTVYATAQGAIAVTGFDAAGQAQSVSQGVPTAGRVANGAIVERASPYWPYELPLSLILRNPDYATAVRIVDVINAFAEQRYRRRAAVEVDARTIKLAQPPSVSLARFMAEIGELLVEPDTVARVVMDARTGTVVIGQDVQISTVAITHGTLTIKITETPKVSQPAPRSKGTTTVVPGTSIDVSQDGGPVAVVGGSSLRDLVNGLNRIGAKPDGIMAILQAIKSAGALQADLVAQ